MLFEGHSRIALWKLNTSHRRGSVGPCHLRVCYPTCDVNWDITQLGVAGCCCVSDWLGAATVHSDWKTLLCRGETKQLVKRLEDQLIHLGETKQLVMRKGQLVMEIACI